MAGFETLAIGARISAPEIAMTEALDAMQFDYEYQPDPIVFDEEFIASSGKKYQEKKYFPDFIVNYKGYKFVIETKGDNDKVFSFRKGQKPKVIDKSEEYALKHRQLDKFFSTQEKTIFMIVRLSNLKTPEYAGLFWDHDWSLLKGFKTKKRLDLCANVPRVVDRIVQIYINKKAEEQAKAQLALDLGGDNGEANEK